jgi:hypothetical protein
VGFVSRKYCQITFCPANNVSGFLDQVLAAIFDIVRRTSAAAFAARFACESPLNGCLLRGSAGRRLGRIEPAPTHGCLYCRNQLFVSNWLQNHRIDAKVVNTFQEWLILA